MGDDDEGPTKLDLSAEDMGYRPWDPGRESRHAWEYGFIQHCVRTQGRTVRRNRDWFLEQGFRPVMLDTFLDVAHRPRGRPAGERRPLMSDPVKGLVLFCMVLATFAVFYFFFPDQGRACLVLIVIEVVVSIVAALMGENR